MCTFVIISQFLNQEKKGYWIQNDFCFSKIHLKTKQWFFHKPNMDFLKNSKMKPILTWMVLIMVTFTGGLLYLGPTQERTSRCWYGWRGGLFDTIKLIKEVLMCFVLWASVSNRVRYQWICREEFSNKPSGPNPIFFVDQ